MSLSWSCCSRRARTFRSWISAFGKTKGLGDFHHQQYLHTLRFVWQKEKERTDAAARQFMDDEPGAHERVPLDPNAGRWLYRAKAAKHEHDLRQLESPITGEPFIPHFFRQMAELTTQTLPKKNWTDLADQSQDPRIIAAMALDMEVMDRIHGPALDKTKGKTRQGWSGMFMIFDVYEWWYYEQRPMWTLISRDPKGFFTNTYGVGEGV